MIREIKKEAGVIVSDDRQGMDTLIGYLAETIPAELFELAANKVDLFFTYSMCESDVHNDGSTTWTRHTATGKTLYAVGIAQEAIAQGRQYACLVWLHELAHVLCGMGEGHTELFHSMLDQMLILTNETTGANIVNDYYGLSPDLRPDAPN